MKKGQANRPIPTHKGGRLPKMSRTSLASKDSPKHNHGFSGHATNHHASEPRPKRRFLLVEV